MPFIVRFGETGFCCFRFITEILVVKVRTYQPHPSLSSYIKCYYHLENSDDSSIIDLYFADGCIEAVFSIGWDFYKENVREDWAKVIGQIVNPRKLNIIGTGQSFGIWFYPHTFSCFSNVKMFELNDRTVPCDLLFSKALGEFVGNCLAERKFDRLINGVDQFLMNQLSRHKSKSMDRLVHAALVRMYQEKTECNLDVLAGSLNVTNRYLQRAFHEKVGYGPKHFLKMLRFQQALQRLGQATDASLTGLAYDVGYWDQSHFIRDFKSFTGMSPSEFRPEKLPINQYFITAG